MKRSFTTKKALLLNSVSLLLCIVMLMGTSFAWFTDIVESKDNIIVAGNLDVELEYYSAAGWQPVNENTKLFDENALWEPGHTETVYLRVSNLGSLALKYMLGVWRQRFKSAYPRTKKHGTPEWTFRVFWQ